MKQALGFALLAIVLLLGELALFRDIPDRAKVALRALLVIASLGAWVILVFTIGFSMTDPAQ